MAANRFLVFLALPVWGNLVLESATRNELQVSREDYYTDAEWFGGTLGSCSNYTCTDDANYQLIVDLNGKNDCPQTGCSDEACCFNVAYGPVLEKTPKCIDTQENVIEKYPLSAIPDEPACRARCDTIGDTCKYYQHVLGFCTLYKSYCSKNFEEVRKQRTCDDVVNATGKYPEECVCGKTMLKNQQFLWCGSTQVGDAKTFKFNMLEVAIQCQTRLACNADEAGNARRALGSMVKGAAVGVLKAAKKAAVAGAAAAKKKYQEYKVKKATKVAMAPNASAETVA